MIESHFWLDKKLDEMNLEEWETLCDGCARCCLFKIEDEETGEIYFTNVVCRLLDIDTCLCTDYPNRQEKVPTCLILNPERAGNLKWLPSTCAYHRLAQGKNLFWWHPLISKDIRAVHMAGVSVKGKAISEDLINMDDLQDFIVDWLD
jgi:uncharacterized protein